MHNKLRSEDKRQFHPSQILFFSYWYEHWISLRKWFTANKFKQTIPCSSHYKFLIKEMVKDRKRFAPRRKHKLIFTDMIRFHTIYDISFQNICSAEKTEKKKNTNNNSIVKQNLNNISLKIFSIFNSKETRNLKIEHMGYVEHFSIQ